ncbi:MAG: heparan-alpha-glucosaminide N-acetyltransferase domain-containing protein [Candidatus Thorarchaeota archaeon]
MNQQESDSDNIPTKKSRIGWVDALRGIAIVLMIFIHIYRGWAEESVSELPFYLPSEIFLGFAPTFFLGVVGMSLFLSMNKREDTAYYVKRGVGLFVGGFSLNIASLQPERFNIFHIIGLAILVIALIRAMGIGSKGIFIIACAIVLFTPLVNILDPNFHSEFLIDTITPVAYDRAELIQYVDGNALLLFLQNALLAKASYPIFPWLSYALVGYLVSKLLLTDGDEWYRSDILVIGFGVIIMLASIVLTTFYIPIFKYPTTVNYFLISTGAFLFVTGLIIRIYSWVGGGSRGGLLGELEYSGHYAFEIFIIQYFAIRFLSEIKLGPELIFVAMFSVTAGIIIVFHVADRYGSRILQMFRFYSLTELLRKYILLLVALSFVLGIGIYYIQVVIDKRSFLVYNSASFLSVIIVYWYLMTIRRSNTKEETTSLDSTH